MKRSSSIELAIQLPDPTKGRLYFQVVEAIEAGIRSGQISVGQRLPSERSLAASIGVSRTTVTTAYAELEARGLVRGFVGRGTVVVATPPDPTGSRFPWSQRSTSVARQASQFYGDTGRKDIIPFEIGWQHESLYPTEALNSLLRQLARQASADLYAPPPPRGDAMLLEAVSEWLHPRGMRIDPDSILITAGAQQGLTLLARAFVQPGDIVVTEMPTFLGALMAFRWASADIIGVPVDEHGLLCDALEEVLARHRPKLIFLMPTFQNPTGAVLTAERRQSILEMATRYRVPLVESDLYGDVYFDQPPPAPLKAKDASGAVIYLGGVSKLVAPSLRIGWLAASPGALAPLAAAKAFEDLHTPTLTQRLAAQFLRSSHFEAHVATLRTECRRRRDKLVAALQRDIPSLRFRTPPGGYYLWAQLPPPLLTEPLMRNAGNHGVAIRAGIHHMPETGGEDWVRLCFASVGPNDIVKGVKRLGAALEETWQELENSAPAKTGTRVPMV